MLAWEESSGTGRGRRNSRDFDDFDELDDDELDPDEESGFEIRYLGEEGEDEEGEDEVEMYQLEDELRGGLRMRPEEW